MKAHNVGREEWAEEAHKILAEIEAGSTDYIMTHTVEKRLPSGKVAVVMQSRAEAGKSRHTVWKKEQSA